MSKLICELVERGMEKKRGIVFTGMQISSFYSQYFPINTKKVKIAFIHFNENLGKGCYKLSYPIFIDEMMGQGTMNYVDTINPY